MESFIHDLRFGVRMLVKNPGFTWIAVLTLALGIGANTAIFSVVNTVLLRPLPHKDAEQLLAVWAVQTKANQTLFSPAEFLDYQTQNQSFTEMAAYRFMPFTLTGQGDPEQIDGSIVSANFFSLLGVPFIGHVVADRSGHAMHTRLVEQILNHPEKWVLLNGPESVPMSEPVPALTALRSASLIALQAS